MGGRQEFRESEFPRTPCGTTFAVLYVRGGGDSFSLQEILGHTTLGMTRQYVHLARHDIADQHKKFSPMQTFLGKSKDAVQSKAFRPAVA